MIIPIFPVVELIDRWAIAIVKFQRNVGNYDEYNFYNDQLEQYDLNEINSLLQQLIKTHNEIWDLEKELKSGKEHLLPLEEIGLRAIKIRDKNNQRVQLKNQIAEILGCKVREIKKDHLSQ